MTCDNPLSWLPARASTRLKAREAGLRTTVNVFIATALVRLHRPCRVTTQMQSMCLPERMALNPRDHLHRAASQTALQNLWTLRMIILCARHRRHPHQPTPTMVRAPLQPASRLPTSWSGCRCVKMATTRWTLRLLARSCPFGRRPQSVLHHLGSRHCWVNYRGFGRCLSLADGAACPVPCTRPDLLPPRPCRRRHHQRHRPMPKTWPGTVQLQDASGRARTSTPLPANACLQTTSWLNTLMTR